METKNHQLTKNDLFEIHSYAIDYSTRMNYKSELQKDPQMLMAYCWTMGVQRWLKSKNYIEMNITWDENV